MVVDAATGRTRWRAEPQAEGLVGDEQLLAVSDRAAVLANTDLDRVEARALVDGRRLWERTVAQRVISLGACPGYRLTAVTHRAPVGDKTTLVLHALDSQSGASLWQQPVAGPIAGAGGGHLFVAQPSGVGRLSSSVVAYRCADGRPVPLPNPSTRFTSLQQATDEGAVLLFGFNFARTVQQLCVVFPGVAARQCVDVTAFGSPGYRLNAAGLRGRYLYVSMGHLVAHNLDPTPDSAVTVYDLADRRVVATTPPMVANAEFVDAGSLLLTGMGGTGARDFAHLLDPADGRIVRKLALAQAATALAADEQHAFVASRRGRLYALALPLPGPTQRPARAVQAQPLPSVAGPPRSSATFELVEQGVIDAHPPRGVTSGQATAGAVGALAFLGPDGRQLVAGGNDDRLRIFPLAAGAKAQWQSPSLGKDVQGLSACRDERFAAQIYGGSMRVYRRVTPGAATFAVQQRLRHGHAWMFGLTQDCQRVVSDTLDHGDYRIYDAATGKLLATALPRGRFDRRGTRVRAGRLAYLDRQGQVVVLGVDGTAGAGTRELARLSLPVAVGGPKLVQLWAIDERSLLAEYCSSQSCIVRLYDLGGRTRHQLEFDIRGSVWSATVPSNIDVSADGAFLAFFRDGLDMSVTRISSGERHSLGSLRRTMSSTPMAVFSPFDARLFAVAMRPQPHQVSILRIRERGPAR